MIAPWIAYAITVSLLLGLAGTAAEQSLRALGRPGRWGVAGGLVASLALSTAALVAPGRFFPGSTGVARFFANSLEAPILQQSGTLAEIAPGPEVWMALDTPLLTLWILGSLTVILVGLIMQRRLVLSALRCSPEEVAGVQVRRTHRLGPAVVGCLRAIIVLPEWTRALEPNALELSVSHENEHLRARDPFLLFVAYLLVALQPWNPFLWWQISRLKRAIEADCDRRVLDQGADPRAYAALLLSIASRRSWSPPFAVPLRKGRSRVGRRIALMADSLGGPRPGVAVLAISLVGAILGVGLQVPVPNVSPGAVPNATPGAVPNATPGAVPKASPPSIPAALPPIVVKGDEAWRMIDHIRERVTLPQEPDIAVEVPLEDGGLLRIATSDTSPAPSVTLVLPGQPHESGPPRQMSVKLDVVDGEPVFTFSEV